MRKNFIIGCPRSGTTLVHKLFAQHPDVYTVKETHYFSRIRRRGKRKLLDHLLLSRDKVWAAYEFIRANNELLGQYDPSGARTLGKAAEFLDKLMTSEAHLRRKPAWVEKTPQHLYHIDLIECHIPSARFIHVIRDGRDVVASLVDAAVQFGRKWAAYESLDESIKLYNRCLSLALSYRGQEDHFFVSYENIVRNAPETRQRLYALVGLEISPSNLMGLGDVHRGVAREDEEWKESTNEVSDTRLLKFRRVLDEDERDMVQESVIDHRQMRFDV